MGIKNKLKWGSWLIIIRKRFILYKDVLKYESFFMCKYYLLGWEIEGIGKK